METELCVFPAKRTGNGLMAPLSYPDLRLRQNVEAFISYLPVNGYRVRCKRIPLDYSVKENYFYNLRCSQKNERDLHPIPWENVVKRMRRCYFVDGRKNRENLAFRWGNVFLTNSLFTFGSRTVQEDECHIIQTHNTRILFYLNMGSSRMGDEMLNASAEFQYRLCVLQRHSVYLVMDMSYVLLTHDKTLFALDCCAIDIARRLQNEFHVVLRDPTEHQLGITQSNRPTTAVSSKSKRSRNRKRRRKNTRIKHNFILPPSAVDKIMSYPGPSEEMKQSSSVKESEAIPVEECMFLSTLKPPAEKLIPSSPPADELVPLKTQKKPLLAEKFMVKELKPHLPIVQEMKLTPRPASVDVYEGLKGLCRKDEELTSIFRKHNATDSPDELMALTPPVKDLIPPADELMLSRHPVEELMDFTPPVKELIPPADELMLLTQPVEELISLTPPVENLKPAPHPSHELMSITHLLREFMPPSPDAAELTLTLCSASVDDFEGLHDVCLCSEDQEMISFLDRQNATASLGDLSSVPQNAQITPVCDRQYSAICFDYPDSLVTSSL